jgi:hypothetical protein
MFWKRSTHAKRIRVKEEEQQKDLIFLLSSNKERRAHQQAVMLESHLQDAVNINRLSMVNKPT